MSTALQLVTDDEGDVLARCPDSTLTALVWELCSRPFLPVEVRKDSNEASCVADEVEEELGDGEVPEVPEKGGRIVDVVKMLRKSVKKAKGRKGKEARKALALLCKRRREQAEGPDSRNKRRKVPRQGTRQSKRIRGDTPDAVVVAPAKPTSQPAQTATQASDAQSANLSTGTNPSKRATNTEPLYRADLDRCGALATYLVSRLTGVRLQNEDECLFSILPLRTIGEDVSMGPIYFARSVDVAKLAFKVRAVVKQRLDAEGLPLDDATVARTLRSLVEAQFEPPNTFPSVLGGVADITKAKDMEYGTTHSLVLLRMLEHAVERGSGLLVYFL